MIQTESLYNVPSSFPPRSADLYQNTIVNSNLQAMSAFPGHNWNPYVIAPNTIGPYSISQELSPLQAAAVQQQYMLNHGLVQDESGVMEPHDSNLFAMLNAAGYTLPPIHDESQIGAKGMIWPNEISPVSPKRHGDSLDPNKSSKRRR
jgi:hypothetical protein